MAARRPRLQLPQAPQLAGGLNPPRPAPQRPESDRLLEARKAALETQLATPAPPPVRLHPNLAQLYREKVAALHTAIADPKLRAEALELIRGLIERAELHPAEDGFASNWLGRSRTW